MNVHFAWMTVLIVLLVQDKVLSRAVLCVIIDFSSFVTTMTPCDSHCYVRGVEFEVHCRELHALHTLFFFV